MLPRLFSGSCCFGILMNSASTTKASTKLARSQIITPSIPAKANTAVASTGFRMVTRELEKEIRPLVF